MTSAGTAKLRARGRVEVHRWGRLAVPRRPRQRRLRAARHEREAEAQARLGVAALQEGVAVEHVERHGCGGIRQQPVVVGEVGLLLAQGAGEQHLLADPLGQGGDPLVVALGLVEPGDVAGRVRGLGRVSMPSRRKRSVPMDTRGSAHPRGPPPGSAGQRTRPGAARAHRRRRPRNPRGSRPHRRGGGARPPAASRSRSSAT